MKTNKQTKNNNKTTKKGLTQKNKTARVYRVSLYTLRSLFRCGTGGPTIWQVTRLWCGDEDRGLKLVLIFRIPFSQCFCDTFASSRVLASWLSLGHLLESRRCATDVSSVFTSGPGCDKSTTSSEIPLPAVVPLSICHTTNNDVLSPQACSNTCWRDQLIANSMQ